MKVTSQQKVLGGILAFGAVALIADRALFLDTAPAPAAEPASQYALPAPPPGQAPAKVEPAAPIIAVAQRLRNAGKNAVDNPGRDPFTLGAAWPQTPGAPNETNLTAAQFKQSHRLTGVLKSGDKSHVMIDGRIVGVGQVIDGYRLVSISHRSATFEAGESQIILNMAERSGTASVAP